MQITKIKVGDNTYDVGGSSGGGSSFLHTINIIGTAGNRTFQLVFQIINKSEESINTTSKLRTEIHSIVGYSKNYPVSGQFLNGSTWYIVTRATTSNANNLTVWGLSGTTPNDVNLIEYPITTQMTDNIVAL